MSFRRSSERSSPWRRWLDRHRDDLASVGLPDWVYADQQRWQRFLGEGGLDEQSGWRVEMLSAEQAERLRMFLMANYGPEDYSRCLRALAISHR